MQNVVVVDQIRSLYNVGAIIRAADAFGFHQVIVCGYTPTPADVRLWKRQLADPDVQIKKTALKGLQTVDWRKEDSAAKAIQRLKAEGYFCVAIEQHPRSIDLAKSNQAPLAVVVGNELSGVSPQALALCDQIMRIPMGGRGHSLNVAVAFGIAAFTLTRA